MFRKTLFTLTAVVALGTASTAMAMHGGGGGGGGGGGLGGGHGWGGGAGMHSGGGGWGDGPGLSGARPGGMAPMTMRGANARAMTTAPMTGGRVQGGPAEPHGTVTASMIISTTGSATAISSRSALAVRTTTPRITPAGHRFRVTMAGNGFTCAATIPTGTRIRQ